MMNTNDELFDKNIDEQIADFLKYVHENHPDKSSYSRIYDEMWNERMKKMRKVNGKAFKGISITKVNNGYILSISFDIVNSNNEYTPFVESEYYIYTDVQSVITKITEILEEYND